jgi:GT2 family glycosyltransferase
VTQSAPRVWAIVLTAGGEDITAACLDSLLAQDYPALTVLLVDNASPDGSGARLRDRYASIAYLNTGANLGFPGGNNRGMELAIAQGAEYVMVVNNDTVADPRCVSLLVAAAVSQAKVGAVSPKILHFSEPDRIWFGGGDFSMKRAMGIHRRAYERDTADDPGAIEAMSFATGCCVLFPANVARETRGFAEDFFLYCEDAELSLRMVRMGYRLYYQPAARVFHKQLPVSADPTPFQIVLRDRNRRRIARRHFGMWDRLMFHAWFAATRAVRLTQYVARGDWARAGAIVRGALAR